MVREGLLAEVVLSGAPAEMEEHVQVPVRGNLLCLDV